MRSSVPIHEPCPSPPGSKVLSATIPACRWTRRSQHAALHLRDHRAAQGGDADQRQPFDRDLRSRHHLPHHRRHREPGRHAALSHRRIGLGVVRHVAGRTLGHSARRRSDGPSGADRRRADHRDVRRSRSPDAAPGHPVAGQDGPLEPAADLLRGIPHLRRRPGQVHGGLRVRLLSGLRHDRDDGCDHGTLLRGSRSRRPAAGSACARPGSRTSSVALRVVDPDSGQDAALGAVGEVWTRSPYNMAGYWRKPEETAATIDADGWLQHRRRRVLRRRRLPVPARSDQGHDRQWGREHLPGRSRERAAFASGHRRRSRHRRARPEVGRDGQSDRRAGSGRNAGRGQRHRALPRQSGALQVPDFGRRHGRFAAQPFWQDPQARSCGRPTGPRRERSIN